MEQLTQMELKKIKNQMNIIALALKKCKNYQQQVQDTELNNIFQEAEQAHQNQLQTLLNQLRNFNGQEH
ncbi:hypothetical protein [Acetohalobium arabaticum]|uniref:Spore coat protein n=1 Tax=Acetohalobium arabaticum (strain ATCC 49924 / DSM 5501 / Z-7288) TaxID=574087 RepID=D9QSM6_ACEAZ|nr:hypothetical protein [Acetohalobium arabaticum]ADL13489.1 conserved hypothetical protein [Acetohalobium arabaticum DSM 5501]